MMTFILVIHSITCVLLVLTILMQAGRGGGLTEQFASAESVFGAQTSSFMVRATSILATVFFITSLTLALMSSGQERSLMANRIVASQAQKAADAAATAATATGAADKEAVEPAAAKDVELPTAPAHAPAPYNAPNTVLETEPASNPQTPQQ